jgi:hypothetical protein
MTRANATVRSDRFDLDHATWHAHIAARDTPSPLVFVQRRQGNGASSSTPARAGRVVHLDLATWHAHIAGVAHLAA